MTWITPRNPKLNWVKLITGGISRKVAQLFTILNQRNGIIYNQTFYEAVLAPLRQVDTSAVGNQPLKLSPTKTTPIVADERQQAACFADQKRARSGKSLP
jgi:hypothetical protein